MTPISCGLMEQTRNGPVAWCSAPGPLYPSALDGPKLRGRYSIPCTGNNHAFAFMEPVPSRSENCLPHWHS
jgi:hypothetical protein